MSDLMEETVTEEGLFLRDLECLIVESGEFSLSEKQWEQVHRAFDFLERFSADKVIYGINTGFGPMAQYRIPDEHLEELQYNLIRSHANGTGDFLTPLETRAVMICRLASLALGYSGTSPEVLRTIEIFLEKEIYPVIPRHGGVGASGDLVQLAHLALGLIGEGKSHFQGKILPTTEVLGLAGVNPAKLKLRDGLSLINGTSCMSGLAVLNLLQVEKLLHFSTLASSAMNELASSYTDTFSRELNQAKRHVGQRIIASKMRDFLADGSLLKDRKDHLFNQEHIEGQEYFSEKVQEHYSLRCVPQILGPIYDTYLQAKNVVEEEINSANDNPIVCLETENVYHGGNFHGDYVSFEMDKLKLAVIKLSMLAERQVNYLMNEKLNNKFPPFLNAGRLGLTFGLQGMQFTAVSTTAENQSLGNSLYTHSIPNNGDNQDIVSMGTNAALQAKQVIDNAFEVLSVQLVAIAQAMDLIGNISDFSSSIQGLHRFVREAIPMIVEDRPQYEALARLKKKMMNFKVTF